VSEASPPTRRARRDVAAPAAAPGEEIPPPHRDGDEEDGRLATAQLEMAAFGDHLVPYVPPTPKPPRSVAPWALTLAIGALLSSFFWGWLLPLSVVAVVVAIVSVRRPHDSRRIAVWAVVLAALSAVFSAGWLLWGFSQLPAG